jgi:hypothetical protein
MRPDSPQWIAAKVVGDRAELALADYFRNLGWNTLRALGRADFDLQLQCDVEVKNDLRASETGNVAIEIAYGNQASGIMTSRATWWAIVAGDECYLCKTDELRRVIVEPALRRVYAGDGAKSEIVLVSLERLRKVKTVKVVKLPALAGAE